MILRVFRLLLLGGFAFGALVFLLGQRPAMRPAEQTPAAAPAPPAAARPASPPRSLANIATSIETPLGDAVFRAWCTWTLREKLADRPEWTLPRVATLCLCVAGLMRERPSRDLPDVGRAEFVAGVGIIEERLCRAR